MPASDSSVRPTKRCLDDLGLVFPPLEQSLSDIPNPVIVRAQQVPMLVTAGGAERVLALSDRVWFKVKTGTRRAIVTRLANGDITAPEFFLAAAWWWLGAAGRRREDSGEDFYRSLEVECRRAGRGTGTVDSAHLLPGPVDQRRLAGELALRTILATQELVCRLIARSIKDGQTWSAELQNHRISVTVRAIDSEAYLALGAEGFLDERILGIVLASVPGIAPEDWLPEPDGAMGIQPEFGEILYSAVLPVEIQARIIDRFADEEHR